MVLPNLVKRFFFVCFAPILRSRLYSINLKFILQGVLFLLHFFNYFEYKYIHYPLPMFSQNFKTFSFIIIIIY